MPSPWSLSLDASCEVNLAEKLKQVLIFRPLPIIPIRRIIPWLSSLHFIKLICSNMNFGAEFVLVPSREETEEIFDDELDDGIASSSAQQAQVHSSIEV